MHNAYDNNFDVDTKILSINTSRGIIKDYVNTFPDFSIISTNGSVINENAGVTICVRQLKYSFSKRLPDYTSISRDEMIAMILALSKIPVNFAKADFYLTSRRV